jgi:hypothetical protein
MPSLFKYLPAEYAEKMMTEGDILIGTLYDFRYKEDKERGDHNEGTKTAVTYFKDTVTYTRNEDLPPSLKFIKINGGTVTITNSSVHMRQSILNTYIYCCSQAYNTELKKAFGAEKCIEIFDPHGFGEAVSYKLFEMGLSYSLCLGKPCEYIGHHVWDTVRTEAYWLKDPHYRHQAEYRLVFIPLLKRNNVVQELIITENGKKIDFPHPEGIEVNIQPQVIKCKEAIRYCRWRD